MLASLFSILFGARFRELVVNGGFDVNANGWTSNGATPSQAGGKLIVTADGAGNVSAYQVISGLIPGAAYRFACTVRRLDANSAQAQAGVYDTAPNSTPLALSSVSTGTEVASVRTFIAPADGVVSVSCLVLTAAGAGAQGEFDNISVRRL